MTHREPWRVSTKNGLDSGQDCEGYANIQSHGPRVGVSRTDND